MEQVAFETDRAAGTMRYMATANPRYRVVFGQASAWIGSGVALQQVRAWPGREVDASGIACTSHKSGTAEGE
ncbi:hypothetical protein BZG21_48490 [Escherichia coli]|nr:hypothetical protein [Escherichia coli]